MSKGKIFFILYSALTIVSVFFFHVDYFNFKNVKTSEKFAILPVPFILGNKSALDRRLGPGDRDNSHTAPR